MLMLVGGTWFVSTPILTVVKASTSVSGVMSSDMAWTKTNSPYDFAGPVAVDCGVILTIESGTVNTDAQALSQLEIQEIVIAALVVVVVVLSLVLFGIHMRSRAEKKNPISSSSSKDRTAGQPNS